MMTELILPTARIKVLTSMRMDGNEVRLRKGLRARKLRRISVKLPPPSNPGIRLVRPVVTTTKSNQFHGSWRYVFSPQKNPCATIWITISVVYMVRKYGSLSTTNLLRNEPSGLGLPSLSTFE
jgi:hypothetical protein